MTLPTPTDLSRSYLVGRSGSTSGIHTGDQLRQNFAKWLSPPDPSVNYNTARDKQHRGTAVWFIESSTFREWKKTGRLLWIRGKRMYLRFLRLQF